jgi:CheY-like chemotaxis protein
VKRILVVDDETDVLLSLRIVLETAGYEVVEATTGEDALALIDADPPDLLVLDVVLPGIDGWHVLEAVRERAKIPVILASASAVPGFRERAEASGADAVFTKPFGAEELRRTVARLLSRG